MLFKNKCNPVELTDCTVTVGAVDEWLNSLSSVSRAIENEHTQGTAHKDGDSATQALATQGTQVCFSLLAMAASASLFKPKYRLGHPENYLFFLSTKLFSGSKYPKKTFNLILRTEALMAAADQ